MPALFEPFSLRNVTFRNRIVLSPMCQYSAEDGFIAPWHLDHHARFAMGGLGGALVESTAVMRDGRITPACLGIYRDEHVEGLSCIVDIYRRAGAPVGIQLSHSGRKGSAAPPLEGAAPLADYAPATAWETVAPSAEPLTPDWPEPRALEAGESDAIIEAFATAAERAVTAGFDFVEIHGAHGYLIHSFVSPLSNRRNDAFGGDINGRCRFPLAVAAAIRKVIPDDMPLLYRASAVDGLDGGLELDETIILAQKLKAAGVDLIDCSSGGITGASGRAHAKPSPGYLVPYAEEIRRAAEIPTMAVGLIKTARQAEAIIADGQADLVALGRQMLDDPSFPYHAAVELERPDPEGVLPEPYAFFLRRRPVD